MDNKETLKNLKKDLNDLRVSELTPRELSFAREILDKKLAEIRFYQRRQYYIHY